MVIVDGNCRVEIYIHLLHYFMHTCTRVEGKNINVPDRNRTCEPAFLVQRSNQLSYSGQLSRSNNKFMYIVYMIVPYSIYINLWLELDNWSL